MVVTWVTLTDTNSTVVEYGPAGFSMYVTGTEEIFKDGGSEKRKIYMHRAKMINLKPGLQYGKYVYSQYALYSLKFHQMNLLLVKPDL